MQPNGVVSITAMDICSSSVNNTLMYGCSSTSMNILNRLTKHVLICTSGVMPRYAHNKTLFEAIPIP